MHLPEQTQYDEPEQNEEMDALIRQHSEYIMQDIDKSWRNKNIVLFPPMDKIPEKEINRILGRRNPGETVPEAYRNQETYRLFKSVGFNEIGKTGWLYKRIACAFTKDGFIH